MSELPKAYLPGELETKWYGFWEAHHFFAPALDDRPPYCIVIPPPNVTGALHLGHALNNTLQDILVRYARMNGRDALWVPGTDHAGIATQNVVERQLLKEEKQTRYELGRDELVRRIWAWKEQYGNRIISQLKQLGCSCDWSRTRFTMDDGLSAAVRKVFVELHREGLIYRGEYIVNWCPRCRTALSDVEVDHRETKGNFWHIRYPYADGTGHVVVATTRPETMLGDTAVAVHPDDERYRALVGKTVVLPLMDREIPVVADKYVDPSFGTGIVKITPGHDPNDYYVGQRHNLPLINLLNDDATLNANAGKYAGLDRLKARRQVVADLEAQGLLDKIEPHLHNVGRCYRCQETVEPYAAKKQWFVRMKPLAEPAIKAVEDGRIVFHPAHWANLYFEWMRNTRDWCISRQIWWGHRIPAWYCDCGQTVVAETAPAACPKCGGALRQDEDVLDTWFSSALWPFSTLGWPHETPELKKFYPNAVLSTGFDIIYFWVARMIVMGLHFMKEVPFRDVYIHGLIRTATGEKMSKSSGNIVDPLAMIEKYGVDALRFTMTALAAQGRDLAMDEQRIEGSKHFVNKLWNAARFALMNGVAEAGELRPADLAPEDHWLLARLDTATAAVRTAIEEYRFNDYAFAAYEFTWKELCDWYIELAKPRLTGSDEREKAAARAVLKRVLKQTLELLHPAIPFITEEIWQQLRGAGDPASVMLAPFPAPAGGWDGAAVQRMERLQEIIAAVRTIRGELGIEPKQAIALVAEAPAAERELLAANRAHLASLAKVATLDWRAGDPPKPAAATTLGELSLWVPLTGVIDLAREKARLQKEIGNLGKQAAGLEAKLANAAYLAKAPAKLVERDRELLAELQAKRARLAGFAGQL